MRVWTTIWCFISGLAENVRKFLSGSGRVWQPGNGRLMSWRLADSLERLRGEVNRRWPDRSKASDGTIGDRAHASRKSDHNPNGAGVVTAIDLTDDGEVGERLWQHILNGRDPRVKYAIFDRRIVRSYSKPGIPAWVPTAYNGSNPHTTHIHVSVSSDQRLYDSQAPWGVDVVVEEDDDVALRRGTSGPAVQAFQRALQVEAGVAGRPEPLPDFGPDGDFGAETERAVRAYQSAAKVPVSGAIDGVTAALLARYITVA